MIEDEISRLYNTNVGANKDMQEFLTEHNSTPLKTGSNLAELIRRPELSYELLEKFDPDRKKLADAIISYKEEKKTFDYADFICYTCLREDLNNTLKSVCSYPQSENYTEEELNDYILRVKERRVQKEEERLKNLLKNTIDKNEQKKILDKLFNIKKEVLKW